MSTHTLKQDVMLKSGKQVTPDIGGKATTSQMAEAVVKAMG